VGQRLSFAVTSGQTYTISKYVGVVSSQSAADPISAARGQAGSAAAAGFPALLVANRAAWARLWSGRIEVQGDAPLATDVNASEFYLWSSTRSGVNWSISPAGLSSNGYNGHIFWDAETWMFPSLLAQHPDLALGMNTYRFQRLGAAEQHAHATGYKGARFPWESALDGTEQIPPPVSVNSEGVYEQHITADVALAQWQYYLGTGDLHWLRTRGWPVISQAARFWASRVARSANGSYHINHVTGPDEENPNVNDEVYTNVAAATTLQDARQAARVLGIHAPASWSNIAAKLVVLRNRRLKIHPEFRGYRGQLVKQADVTLIQYPWGRPMPPAFARHDINYYVPRTDPQGPSMSDAVNSIDTSALGVPGCASFVYTLRSYQPFIRDVFDQFSETSTGGAFTFMTGIGGFLQEFLYGYTGMRWNGHGLEINPSLTRQLGGVVVRNLKWRGRDLTISVGQNFTTVHLQSGPALTVFTVSGSRHVTAGHSILVPTRRPDRIPSADVVRCGSSQASSAAPAGPALAAVDGSPATDWQPSALPARLTVAFRRGGHSVNRASLRWGRSWPPPPAPNVHPPPGPVKILRPARYQLLTSNNGHHWRVVATVGSGSRGTVDVLHFRAVRARFARVRIISGKGSEKPELDELRLS
jgi:trehalose/maltose hydrolase-like predicted phosphorylase